MTNENKQQRCFTLIPTIEINDDDDEPDLFDSRSTSSIEQPVIVQEKSSEQSSRVSKLLLYTPPDSLMFPLFSAIQRKAWVRAKKLCYEVILCNPERKIYYELYRRLEQIINNINRQPYRQSVISQATTTSTNSEKLD